MGQSSAGPETRASQSRCIGEWLEPDARCPRPPKNSYIERFLYISLFCQASRPVIFVFCSISGDSSAQCRRLVAVNTGTWHSQAHGIAGGRGSAEEMSGKLRGTGWPVSYTSRLAGCVFRWTGISESRPWPSRMADVSPTGTSQRGWDLEAVPIRNLESACWLVWAGSGGAPPAEVPVLRGLDSYFTVYSTSGQGIGDRLGGTARR